MVKRPPVPPVYSLWKLKLSRSFPQHRIVVLVVVVGYLLIRSTRVLFTSCGWFVQVITHGEVIRWTF
jgi:hypothetical protein